MVILKRIKRRTLTIHNVKQGQQIESRIDSNLWISKGEIFLVRGVVRSELTNELGVSFYDRNGSKRVFWNSKDYEIIEE